MSCILVVGGIRDPNVKALLEAAEGRGIDTIPLLIGSDLNPTLTWDLDSNALFLDNQPLRPTGVFARRDVFHASIHSAYYRALAWHCTFQGWISTNPKIRILNRGYLGRFTNKLHALRSAQEAGLPVPSTVITNDFGYLADNYQSNETIAKPVTGGGYCNPLDELLGDTPLRDNVAASPAIVQPKLMGRDVRIYWIGGLCFGFRIQADAIDYRQTKNVHIEPVRSLPHSTVKGLGCVMEAMGLNWGAADFKEDPENKKLTFLEINSDPMFSKFDQVARGAITNAILDYLLKHKEKYYSITKHPTPKEVKPKEVGHGY